MEEPGILGIPRVEIDLSSVFDSRPRLHNLSAIAVGYHYLISADFSAEKCLYPTTNHQLRVCAMQLQNSTHINALPVYFCVNAAHGGDLVAFFNDVVLIDTDGIGLQSAGFLQEHRLKKRPFQACRNRRRPSADEDGLLLSIQAQGVEYCFERNQLWGVEVKRLDAAGQKEHLRLCRDWIERRMWVLLGNGWYLYEPLGEALASTATGLPSDTSFSRDMFSVAIIYQKK